MTPSFSVGLANVYILQNMKPSITFCRSLLIGITLLGFAVSSSVTAHQVGDPNGKSNHQHVYKPNAYGKGATAGHHAQPAGSRGIVIWQAAPSRSYAKTQPGIKIPSGHTKQPSQKQMYQQKPAFNKQQSRTPVLDKR